MPTFQVRLVVHETRVRSRSNEGLGPVTLWNLRSKAFTGKKLTSAGGPKARDMDIKQMMIWGNLVRAQRPASAEEESSDLVPKSW